MPFDSVVIRDALLREYYRGGQSFYVVPRIKDLPDIFYTRCQVYTRGAIGEVAVITHESPAPEDEAWGHVDHSEWFYIIRFKQKDLWPEYPDTFGNDSLQTEFSERWLEPA